MGEAGPVEVGADITPCEEAVADCQKQIDGVEEERQQTDFNIRHTIRSSIRVIGGTIGLAVSAFGLIGGTMDPVQQALLGCVTSTISALSAIATAMGSNPITATFAIVTGAASIILSTRTFWEVLHGMEKNKDEMGKVNDMLRMAHSAYSLSRGLGT
jgi:hypothetical protein